MDVPSEGSASPPLLPKPSKFFALVVLGTLFTILTSFFGAPLFRVARAVYGALWYWIIGIAFIFLSAAFKTTLFPALLAGVWATVGIYSELELRGRAGFRSLLAASTLGTLILFAVGAGLSAAMGQSLEQEVRSAIEVYFAQLKKAGSSDSLVKQLQVAMESVFGLVPSLVYSLMVSNLAFAVILDRRTAQIFQLPYNMVSTHLKLYDFKVPDFGIWVTLVSAALALGGRFLPPDAVNLGLNFVIAMGTIYFFQGLAILEVGFFLFRVGFFLRLAVYLLLVGQLFFLLSLAGVVDYWVDFRTKFRKWSAQLRKKLSDQ